MPYVTPSTHIAGETFPAADWNVVVNDIIALSPFFSAWTAYTPTLTNVTTGNGTLTGKYLQVGDIVWFTVQFVLGTTSAVSGDVTITLPTSRADARGGMYSGGINCAGTNYNPFIFPNAADVTTLTIRAQNSSGTYGTATSFSATIPNTWAATNDFYVNGAYEAA